MGVIQVNLFQKLLFLNQLTHKILFIEFPEKYNFTTCCVQKLFFCFCFDIQNNICTQHVVNLYFSGNWMNNLSSYCELTDSRMSLNWLEKDFNNIVALESRKYMLEELSSWEIYNVQRQNICYKVCFLVYFIFNRANTSTNLPLIGLCTMNF